TFREDLYYRISEMVIDIPPLRDREGDKILLARFMLDKYRQEQNKNISSFTPAATNAIEAYKWPGNIRELENKIKRAVIMSDSKKIDNEDLDLDDGIALSINLRSARQKAEINAINTALSIADGNMSACAKLLGITRPTLYDLIKKYDMKNALAASEKES
ncbi:MAG: helix-turn-helix domain-containing protein, partial [Pseudomonadales bacterium]